VTHDQVEAMTLADRIVIMKDGLIQQVGTPLSVYDDPENVHASGFIGSPTVQDGGK
jgi:ABC-type sugar transport system ATPase subunit